MSSQKIARTLLRAAVAGEVQELLLRHLPGKHDQSTHGRKGPRGIAKGAVKAAVGAAVEAAVPEAKAQKPNKVMRPRKQPARLDAKGIADAVASGVAERQVLLGGDNSVTEIIRTKSGALLVHKKVADLPNDPKGIRSAKRQVDAEELGHLMAEAIGAPVPRVHRTGDDEVHMEFMAGAVARNAPKEKREAAADTPAGARLGLLDLVSQAWDRHTGNWMIDVNGNPVGFDHAFAFNDHRQVYVNPKTGEVPAPNPFNPSFVHHFIDSSAQGRHWRQHQIPAAEMAQIRSRLAALRPVFEKRGRLAWWEDGMTIFNTIAKYSPDATP